MNTSAAKTLHPRPLITVLLLALLCTAGSVSADGTLLVGDPGGDTREMRNSLPALAYGASVGIDYIELELVATKDQQVIVYHSPDLASHTDIAERFPDRSRADGGYYSVDFTLDEIRQLRRRSDGFQYASTPLLGIPTLNEYLSVVRHLESRLKKTVGLAPVLLYPELHQKAQVDLSSLTLQILQRYGYGSTESRLLLQCASGDELKRIKEELMMELAMELPLVQRIEAVTIAAGGTTSALPAYDHSWMFTRMGTRMLSSYASGVAVDISYLYDEMGSRLNTAFFENVRTLEMKLLVLGTTETLLGPPPLAAGNTVFDYLYTTIGADGIIASSPMDILEFLKEREGQKQNILLPLLQGSGDHPPPAPAGGSAVSP